MSGAFGVSDQCFAHDMENMVLSQSPNERGVRCEHTVRDTCTAVSDSRNPLMSGAFGVRGDVIPVNLFNWCVAIP